MLLFILLVFICSFIFIYSNGCRQVGNKHRQKSHWQHYQSAICRFVTLPMCNLLMCNLPMCKIADFILPFCYVAEMLFADVQGKSAIYNSVKTVFGKKIFGKLIFGNVFICQNIIRQCDCLANKIRQIKFGKIKFGKIKRGS